MVIDTHVWLWFLCGEEISAPVRSRLQQDPQSILLSPISVWEAVLLAQRGKIQIDGSPVAHFREALKLVPVTPAPLSHEIALASRQLKAAHEDPADRFIAATAMVYGVPLATADRRLWKIPGLETVKAR